MTTDDLTAALKPCPFCGGSAEMDTRRAYRNISTGRAEDACAVYCLGCEADMTICYRDVPDWTTEDAVSYLAEAWNRRAARAPGSVIRTGYSPARCCRCRT